MRDSGGTGHEEEFVGEHRANMLGSLVVARRPDPEKPDVLNEEELKQLRHNLAHLSPGGVREFYERGFEDCRPGYNRLPSPRKMQILVQAWEAVVEVAIVDLVPSLLDGESP